MRGKTFFNTSDLNNFRPVCVSRIGRPNKIFIRQKYTLLIIFFGLLAIGLFDHYLWTIQQGSILFWTVLGLLSAKNRLNANAQPVILPSYN